MTPFQLPARSAARISFSSGSPATYRSRFAPKISQIRSRKCGFCEEPEMCGVKMTLSVKEMSNADETTGYFNSLAGKLGKKQELQGLGQGAFLTNDGSVVTRKDYKVLLVDTTKLPARFGVPPSTRGDIAINVSATIMNCWVGA